MFTAPAVACEISEPPRMPRGTSCSGPGLTTFTSASLPSWRRRPRRPSSDGKTVVDPFRAPRAHPLVEPLGAVVVLRRLPAQPHGAALAAALDAGLDERGRRAAAPGRRHDEQVVHH